MEGGPRYFSGEMYEASHALAYLADIKRRLRADLTDLTYVQVRLLMESIGKVRQVQGLYQSYSFLVRRRCLLQSPKAVHSRSAHGRVRRP